MRLWNKSNSHGASGDYKMIYDFLCQAANPKMTFGVSVTMRFDPRKYSLEA